jgi:two-component system, sporulation sensor kinase D
MEMERALVQSDRLASVGQLAAGLAHEINNPMSIILNHLQLLESENLTKDERQRFMTRMESEIKRVSRLVKNLLKFSRDDSSVSERLDPVSVISEVLYLIDPKLKAGKNGENIDRYKLRYDSRSIEVLLHKVREKIHLDCNRDGLKQVILNVLKNSFQSFDDSGGVVEIHLNPRESGDEIVISDNGPGIPKQELSKIFDPFYSLRKTGTGLGLSLCKTMMHRVGGTIDIKSRDGNGTTVILKYPMKDTVYE